MAETLGEAEGVLAIDGTNIPKDGSESVGVARQYCGPLGKQANGQAAVFAAYLGCGAATLVDRRLYLNRDWVSGASHADRRKRIGRRDSEYRMARERGQDPVAMSPPQPNWHAIALVPVLGCR